MKPLRSLNNVKCISALLFLLGLTSVTSRAADFEWIGGGWWGVRVSYALKWYHYRSGGHSHECNFYGEPGKMQGVQFGIPVQPVLWRGLGVSTGVFGEVYSCKNEAETRRIEDVELYFPVHAMWQQHLAGGLKAHVETGPGLTVGLLQHVIDPKDSTVKGYGMDFGQGTPNRVNCYWDVGAGLTYNNFRFSFVYSVGITHNRRFLSTAGAMTEFLDVLPTKFCASVGLMF